MKLTIFKCKNNCESEFQDKTYGKGIRYMNPKGKGKDNTYTCTVCGGEHKSK